ncbi:hypothetical protein PVAP13_3NG034100 [Panicum virgatum]|uniref:Uncharacterized protein n=1 Tax=Panicum virgatum TaxID=38727 RepID=A0A8T0TTQ5_PANVG|nr:hypothetical protein PVAP13_3NG034100 [Panicum virgatum]
MRSIRRHIDKQSSLATTKTSSPSSSQQPSNLQSCCRDQPDICMIEFQKKGLPHAHILQFLGT